MSNPSLPFWFTFVLVNNNQIGPDRAGIPKRLFCIRTHDAVNRRRTHVVSLEPFHCVLSGGTKDTVKCQTCMKGGV